MLFKQKLMYFYNIFFIDGYGNLVFKGIENETIKMKIVP